MCLYNRKEARRGWHKTGDRNWNAAAAPETARDSKQSQEPMAAAEPGQCLVLNFWHPGCNNTVLFLTYQVHGYLAMGNPGNEYSLQDLVFLSVKQE